MPYLHEHAGRLVSPTKFMKATFRSKNIAPGVRIIIAKTCGKCSMQTQAIRFNVCKFTAAKARAWLKKHGYKPIKFEPATGKCDNV